MTRVPDQVRRLLEEHPDLQPVLDELVSMDSSEPWTFDDVDCDSGQFGELVSREFVRSAEDGYCFVDREATRAGLQQDTEDAALHHDAESGSAPSDARTDRVAGGVASSLAQRVRTVDVTSKVRQTIVPTSAFLPAVLLSLGFLFVMRTVHFRTVFREEFVVFPGNDPYHYRYWVDQLFAESPGLFDFAAIADVLGGRASGEPFTYVLGWWITRLIEGSPETSGFALAWLPVIAALCVGVLIAWMALAVTEDERVAVISLLAFAVTPAHALYSGLGFADHHTIDYLWLALMAATLLWLARDIERQGVTAHCRSLGSWTVGTVFGLACAAAMLTWNGAPLLLLGLVLYAVLYPASTVRTDESPLLGTLPVVAGLAVGSVVTHLFHTTAGWQEPAVVYVPAIVLFGVVGVALFGELIDRADGEPWWVLAGSSLVGVVGLVGTWLLAPGIFGRLTDRFLDSLIGRDSAVETQSLLAPELGLTFNPIQHFGLLLLFALPALGLVTWKCIQRHEPRWLVVSSYAWTMFGIAVIQVRFGGELSPFVAILAGVGIVWALSNLDLCRPLACFSERRPRDLQLRSGLGDVNRAVYFSFSLLVIVAIGIILTLAMLNTVAIDDEQHDAAAWIAEDSGEDEGYVLSHWGRNRMYNYFAWGYGDRYDFSQRDYAPFLESPNPDEWHGWMTNPQDSLILYHDHLGNPDIWELRPDGQALQPSSRFGTSPEHVDYIVIDEGRIGEFPRQFWVSSVGQFQLVHTTESDRISVFEPVAGASVTGDAEPGETLELSTEFELRDQTYSYTREVTVDDDGTFSVRVAYPGTYSLADGTTVDVSRADVHDGNSVVLDGE